MKLKTIIGGIALAAILLPGGCKQVRESAEQWLGENLPAEVGELRHLLETPVSSTHVAAEVGLPELTKERPSQVIRHTGYTVSYNAETKLPNYVAWTLTPERFAEVVSRTDEFLPDPEVAAPVTTADYRSSGYDRGHMCPAADNKWDAQAMAESFYMTNVCPQNHNLNRGDWKELEEACREWTMASGTLHVVAGPILYRGRHKRIGRSRVVVPEAFFKVVLSLNPPKAIGFVYKNAEGNNPLDSYVNSVDQVERITGIDFFPSLPDSLETAVEAAYDLSEWPMPGR